MLFYPSFLLRRLGAVAWLVGRVSLEVGLTTLIIIQLVIISGSYLVRWTVQRAIGTYPWDFYALEVDEVNRYSECRLSEIAQSNTDPMLDNILIDLRAPNHVDVRAKWAGIFLVEIPLTVELVGQTPHFQLTEINGIPLFLITENISRGINDGVEGALQGAPVNFTSLEIQDSALKLKVEAGESYSPPIPAVTPTDTGRAAPTPFVTSWP